MADELTKTSRSIDIIMKSWALVAEDDVQGEREAFIVEF